MFNLFQKSTPESRRAQAKANYEKAASLSSTTREATSMRVRIALLCKAHIDLAFVEGAQKTDTWQELCMAAIARAEDKPEPPTPSYQHLAKSQSGEAWTYIPEELTDEVFAIGARYQIMQVTAQQAIDLVQRIADDICQRDLKLNAPFKALQFLRDELEFGAANNPADKTPESDAAPAAGTPTP